MKTDFGKIPELFHTRFEGDFELPWLELSVGDGGHTNADAWHMDYAVGQDEHGLFIEYYMSNRFAWGDIHERIYATGEHLDDLETIQPLIFYGPDDDPAEKERDYDEHNRKVAENLRNAGVFPEHDLNAHLRTNPNLRDGSRH